jgi:hypothetical protein
MGDGFSHVMKGKQFRRPKNLRLVSGHAVQANGEVTIRIRACLQACRESRRLDSAFRRWGALWINHANARPAAEAVCLPTFIDGIAEAMP